MNVIGRLLLGIHHGRDSGGRFQQTGANCPDSSMEHATTKLERIWHSRDQIIQELAEDPAASESPWFSMAVTRLPIRDSDGQPLHSLT